MKCYFWKNSPCEVVPNLQTMVEIAMSSIETFGQLQNMKYIARDLRPRFGQPQFPLAPGQACYFFGGLSSLAEAFRTSGHEVRVYTTCGSGLGVCYERGVIVNAAKRTISAIKTKFAKSEGVADYNEFRKNSVTCVCIYNRNLGGRSKPTGTETTLINAESDLPTIGGFLLDVVHREERAKRTPEGIFN